MNDNTTYFIALIGEDDFEWCIFSTRNIIYAHKVFEDLSAPPGWKAELRATEESIETYKSYEVLKN